MSGRIPQSFVQDLLARTDIVEVIGSRVELKRAGREFKALSPFSHEKSPSFFVSPAKQFFHCFSSGKHGNAIGFLMEYDRLSFVEAVEELAGRQGLEVPHEGAGVAQRLVLDGPLDACAAAERFFREQLRQAPAAIEYLKRRGVSGDTAKHFGIGYAPEGWDALTRFFKDPRHALEAGLLIERDGAPVEASRPGARCYDRFRNRIMFPIRDTRGRVIAFGGRTLANDPAKYLNSPETPLFHKGRQLFGLWEAKQSRKAELPHLLVVEGYMDVVMLAQQGLPEAVATLGTATTREHLALLFKSTRKVVFCFDGDRAGRAAAWRALEQALPEAYGDRECRFMFLPDGHDPDTLVQEIGAEAFRARIDEAMTLSGFLLGELAKQVDASTLDGRARLATLARPHLDKLRDGPLKTLIVDELATRTRLRREDLIGPAPSRAAARPSVATPGGNRPVRRALQLLLERPKLADQVHELELLAECGQPGIAILLRAIEFFHEHPDRHAGQLLEAWRDTPEGAAVARVARSELEREEFGAPLSSRIGDEGLAREFSEIIAELRDKAMRVRVDALLAASTGRELSGSELAEINVLTRQLSQRNQRPAGRTST